MVVVEYKYRYVETYTFLIHLCISNKVYFAWTIPCLENMAEISNYGQEFELSIGERIFSHFFLLCN